MKNILQLTKFLFLVLGLGTFLPNCLKIGTDSTKQVQQQWLINSLLISNLNQFSPYEIDSLSCDAPPPNNPSNFTCTLKLSGGKNASCSIAVSGSMGECNVNVANQTSTSCSNGDNIIQLKGTNCSNLAITLTFTVNSDSGRTEIVKRSKQVKVTF